MRFRQDVYSPINDDVGATAAPLWGDLLRCRLMMSTVSRDDKLGDLMEPKLVAVHQNDLAIPQVVKTRRMSVPTPEFGERTSKERHPECISLRRANVARRVLYWQRRYPGAPVLISKRDVKGTFTLMRICVIIFSSSELNLLYFAPTAFKI